MTIDLWLGYAFINQQYIGICTALSLLLHCCNRFAFHRLCYVTNDVSTNNIRLALHEHQMLLQVQQMRMIIIGPDIFSMTV